MFFDPEYVDMFESMDLANDGEKAEPSNETEVTSNGDKPLTILEQARLEWRAQVLEQPEGAVRRAELGEVTNIASQPSVAPSREIPPSSEVVTGDHSTELLEAPAVEILKEWSVTMFNDPVGNLADLPMLGHVYRETNGLIVNGKQAILELYGTKAFKSALCRSPEREDLKLSQEEALGWLLAHARGRRLLELEARPIGKYAGTQATVAKKELDRIRDAAKVARCKARKKGASAEDLEAIDKKAAHDRAAITEAPFQGEPGVVLAQAARGGGGGGVAQRRVRLALRRRDSHQVSPPAHALRIHSAGELAARAPSLGGEELAVLMAAGCVPIRSTTNGWACAQRSLPPCHDAPGSLRRGARCEVSLVSLTPTGAREGRWSARAAHAIEGFMAHGEQREGVRPRKLPLVW